MENPHGGSRMWPWGSQWTWKTSTGGAGRGQGDPPWREQDVATGICHGGSRIQCSQDVQPPGTCRVHAPASRAPRLGFQGGCALHQPRKEPATRHSCGRGQGQEVAKATLPCSTIAHAGPRRPPALAGKWQQGTKAACGGRRVSALPAGRPWARTRGPCARLRGPCQASLDPATRQHVPAARGGWGGGGKSGRAAAGPLLPPLSAAVPRTHQPLLWPHLQCPHGPPTSTVELSAGPKWA